MELLGILLSLLGLGLLGFLILALALLFVQACEKI